MEELKRQLELIMLKETLKTCESALESFQEFEDSIHFQRIYATANDISQRIAELERG